MTMQPTPEFSRLVKLDAIGRLTGTQHEEANEAERQALARRFGFLSLTALEADYELDRDGKAVIATGRLRASLEQPCIATGEPVPEQVDTPFSIRFLREEDANAPGEELELDATEMDTILLENDRIDMGEAVAETLALSVDPYPRSPGAEAYLRKMGVKTEEQASPFAALAALKKGTEE